MVDRYTKGALTAIALSLSIIAVQNAVGTSAAQQTPMKVQICDDLLHCVQANAGCTRGSIRLAYPLNTSGTAVTVKVTPPAAMQIFWSVTAIVLLFAMMVILTRW